MCLRGAARACQIGWVSDSAQFDARPAAGRFDTLLSLLFLVYMAMACLVLTPLIDINEAKWFVIRAGGPVLLAMVLLRDIADGRRPVIGAIGWLALAFLALHAASLPGAVNLGNGLTEISRLAGLVCTYFLAARIGSTTAGRDRVLWMLLLIGAASSVYGIAQHFGRDFMAWQQHNEVPVARGVSFYGHATFAGSVIIQIIPVAMGLLLARRGWALRGIAAVALALMLYHLSFTGARMATISFVLTIAGAVLWFFLQRRRERRGPASAGRRALAMGLGGVLVVALIGGWFLMRAWQAKESDLFAIRQASFALRIYQWETASRVIYAHPLNGVGAGNYEIVSPSYWNRVEQMRTVRHGRWMQQAHNEYLQTAAELGLPGVAVLVALVAFGLVFGLDAAARAPSRSERLIALALAASLCAIALDANITFSLQAPASALIFWAVLGLISGNHGRVAAEH